MLQNALELIRFKLRNRLAWRVAVADGDYCYTFRCESPVEVRRARTMLIKEKGTIRWLRDEVRGGDVVYDIGANIGLYTLFAGKRVGAAGQVYAFEPHVANVRSLLHNVSENGLSAQVKVLSCALNDRE